MKPDGWLMIRGDYTANSAPCTLQSPTHLHHQANNKHHRDTADDIGVILDDEFMAQNWRILLVFLATNGHS